MVAVLRGDGNGGIGGRGEFDLPDRADRGDKALHARLSKKNATKVVGAFERWGFGAIALPALLPPPMPMVPFVIAAGALQYSQKKFLAAMSAGRLARYFILAYLGAMYGREDICGGVGARGSGIDGDGRGGGCWRGVLVVLRYKRKREALAGGD